MCIKRLLVIYFLYMGAAIASAATEIRNGDELDPQRFPGVGVLAAEGVPRTCTAVAIDHHKILTSARCARAALPSQLRFISPAGIASIREVRIHPDFHPELHDTVDVAVLVLAGRGIDLDWFPSLLEQNPTPFDVGLVVSYGGGSCADGNHSGEMPFRTLAELNPRTPVAAMAGLVFSPGWKDQSTCAGDEGAPVFIAGKVVGVLSHPIYRTGQPTTCQYSMGGLFVGSRYFKPWFDAMTRP